MRCDSIGGLSVCVIQYNCTVVCTTYTVKILFCISFHCIAHSMCIGYYDVMMTSWCVATILIGYHPDSNAILAKTVKNRTSSTLTSAWEQLHSRFQKAGVAPKTYVLDNESSQE